MEIYRGRTADQVWRQAYLSLAREARGAAQNSRAGGTLEALHVAFELDDPRQRWVVSRTPPINPAFAIAEVIWIMAGSNDAAVLNYWNRQLSKYAGATATYPGAYGHRLRRHFGIDQVRNAVEVLRADPDSRQVVLQFWDPTVDMPYADGRPRACDIPCNVTSILKIRDGRLHWTQVMRSNDVLRGLPYNVVQFTSLQEIIAGWIGVGLGRYTHWSDSLHVYEADLPRFAVVTDEEAAPNQDTLITGLEEGEILFEDMYARLLALTRADLCRDEFETLIHFTGRTAGFTSLYSILLAEAARRRSWLDLMREVEGGCTNAQLYQVWESWKMSRASYVAAASA